MAENLKTLFAPGISALLLQHLPGRPGWLPTQAPHRPVRAELSHTVPQVTVSLPCCAIRLRRFQGSVTLCHLSLQRFRDPTPPSLHGVPRDGSPASSVLLGC